MFTEDEIRLLLGSHRPGWVWSEQDALLLDELTAMIAGVEQDTQFSHVVIDEAQNLSPLHRRAIKRLSRNGSMAVLGDINQSIGPWAHEGWPEALADLGLPADIDRQRLQHGYRVPAEVMELAAGLLPGDDPDRRPPKSWRDGPKPQYRRLQDPEARLAAALTIARRRAGEGLMVGLIVSNRDYPAARNQLSGLQAEWHDTGSDGLGPGINLLRAEASRGLEFDAVVLVDPDAIVDGSPWGRRTLYVALTRTTGSLDVVHARERLPWEPSVQPN